GSRAGGADHRAIGAEIADLLAGGAVTQPRTALGTVGQEEGRGDRGVVALPAELVAAGGAAIHHAVGTERAVRQHVHHDGAAEARRVLEHRADHLPGLEVAGLAGGTGAVVVVVAAEGDGTGAGKAVEHQLHDRGGGGDVVVLEVGGGEDRGGTADDVGVLARIERGRVTEQIGGGGRLYLGTTHLGLYGRVLGRVALHPHTAR